jgi:ribokinase
MITVFGSIGMDMLFALPHLPAVGETVLTPSFSLAMGGKGSNQALAAARDRAAVRFVGSIGRDAHGIQARDTLKAEGIDVSGLTMADAATCVATIWYDNQGRNQIAVASGANLEAKAAALGEGSLSAGDWLVVQMEIPATEVVTALGFAKAAQVRTILNLAPALPFDEAALRQVDILILNENEAAQLCARVGVPPALAVDLAALLSKALGNTVIVTLGEGGAIGVSPNGIWRVPAMPAKAVDTTGAGDCFVGVLSAALSRNVPMEAAMRRACIAASMACTIAGAAPSFPTAAAIDLAMEDSAPGGGTS